MSELNDTRVDMEPVGSAPVEAQQVPEPPVVVAPVFLPDPLEHMRQCAKVAHQHADDEQMQAARHREQAEVHSRLAAQHTDAAARNRAIARGWEQLVKTEEDRQVLRAQVLQAEQERLTQQQAGWGHPNPAPPVFGPPPEGVPVWGQPPQQPGSLAALAQAPDGPGLPSVAALAQQPQEQR